MLWTAFNVLWNRLTWIISEQLMDHHVLLRLETSLVKFSHCKRSVKFIWNPNMFQQLATTLTMGQVLCQTFVICATDIVPSDPSIFFLTTFAVILSSKYGRKKEKSNLKINFYSSNRNCNKSKIIFENYRLFWNRMYSFINSICTLTYITHFYEQ